MSKRKASAVLCADLHIRPDTPACRRDNFFAAMERKLDFILALSNQNTCPILVAGDFGQYPRNRGWPTWLSRWTIEKLKKHRFPIIVIPGQHDLPEHQIDLWYESGIGILHAARVLNVIGIEEHTLVKDMKEYGFQIVPFSYGKEIKGIKKKTKTPLVAMAHMMVVKIHSIWPGQKTLKALQLLEKFPGYSLILTGDNHLPFTFEYKGRQLVNPGSMMRSTSNQFNHKPRVYLWFAKTNEIDCIYLPIEGAKTVYKTVYVEKQIDIIEERNEQIQATVEYMRGDSEIKLSFEDNLERYLKQNKTEKCVQTKLWRCVKNAA